MAIKVFQPGEEPVKQEPESKTTGTTSKPEHAKHATHASHNAHHETSASSLEKLSMLLVAVVGLIILFNQLQILQLDSLMAGGTTTVSGPVTEKGIGGGTLDASGDVVNQVIKEIIPTGTPQDYGAELAVSFDDPVPSLTTIASLNRRIPTSALTPEQKERFIGIAGHISCEFCCSAPSVIDSNGRDACGCSHAQAMIGLTKYLVTQHGDTWTDDEIYWELTRWKALFFPKNMVEKGVALVNNGLELTATSLNDLQLIKKLQAGSTDVGGDLASLPNMVGGC